MEKLISDYISKKEKETHNEYKMNPHAIISLAMLYRDFVSKINILINEIKKNKEDLLYIVNGEYFIDIFKQLMGITGKVHFCEFHSGGVVNYITIGFNKCTIVGNDFYFGDSFLYLKNENLEELIYLKLKCKRKLLFLNHIVDENNYSEQGKEECKRSIKNCLDFLEGRRI